MLGRGERPEVCLGRVRGRGRSPSLNTSSNARERILGSVVPPSIMRARELARDFVRLAERDRLGTHQRIGELGERDAGLVDVPATLPLSILTAASNPPSSVSKRCAVSNAS